MNSIIPNYFFNVQLKSSRKENLKLDDKPLNHIVMKYYVLSIDSYF